MPMVFEIPIWHWKPDKQQVGFKCKGTLILISAIPRCIFIPSIGKGAQKMNPYF